MKLRRVTAPAAVLAVLAVLAVGACSAGGVPSKEHASPPLDVISDLPTGLAMPTNLPSDLPTALTHPTMGRGASDTPGAAKTPPPEPIVKQVDGSAEYAGFEITAEKLTYTPASGVTSGTVELDILLRNLADRSGSLGFSTPFSLASGDHHYRGQNRHEWPTVPAKAENEVTLTFLVDEYFSPDDAVLTVGGNATVASVIPLGSAGSPVTNEPRTVDLSGSGRSGIVTATLTGATLRADLPKVFRQTAKHKRYLLIRFEMTNHSSREHPYGDIVVSAAAFTLLEPGGNTITAYNLDDWYGGADVARIVPGATAHDLLATFELDAPVSGEYVLRFTGQQERGADAGKSVAMPFTLQ